MAYPLSPGVNFTEIDLSTVVPGVATSTAAIAGVFRWGPVGERRLISSENDLVSTFGKPTSNNYETFFTAANFLNYGNSLYVVRAAGTTTGSLTAPSTAFNAIAQSANGTTLTFFGNTTSVNTTSEFIYAVTNPFANGEQVVYYPSAGSTAIGGLTSGASYFILNANSSAFNLVDSSGAIINITATGTNTTQNLVKISSYGNIIKNQTDYETVRSGNFDSNVLYAAASPGDIANSLRIHVCDSVNAYSSNINLFQVSNGNNVYGSTTFNIGSNTAAFTFVSQNQFIEANNVANTFSSSFSIGDLLKVGNSSIGTQYLKISSVSAAIPNGTLNSAVTIGFADTYKLGTNFNASNTENGNASVININRNWEFSTSVSHAPTTSSYVANFGNTSAIDTMHVVITDARGSFTGQPGTILEVFQDMSRATDSKTIDGASNYYKNVINKSKYIFWAKDSANAPSATAVNIASSSSVIPARIDFIGGTDGASESTVSLATITNGYDLFASPEVIDISLILQGKPIGGSTTSGGQTVANFQLANYITQNIAEVRKDCVVFVSADDALVRNNPGAEATSLVNWRNVLADSTYMVMTSSYKYTYDRYNDIYRYVPVNGDVAGLCARTDQTNDSWWSPAGFNRGQIKNVVKLRYNPSKADRDLLYKNSINPIVTFPGQGTVLYGDKTATSKPSAFDRINVRRLFITLEKAISKVAQYSLFEFNDEFTRAQFRNLINPYLRDIQARRGVTDFLVVCDNTNNTAERIDRNEFWGDIYIKPNRSINFIQLNFVAVRTGVQFSTIVGQF
jgi:phage tail sheath protein FI